MKHPQRNSRKARVHWFHIANGVARFKNGSAKSPTICKGETDSYDNVVNRIKGPNGTSFDAHL